ncbi:MAG TPA: hypothetical protein VJT78_02375 [Candidatus Dormibacteraeota bacterium]|nr:hypothetical protein [Candidatus Dormibacteraeota bacterium]
MKRLLCFAAFAFLLGSEAWPHAAPPAPLAGFSFSPLTSIWAHRDPVRDLTVLVDTTSPDLVRLPVYWESVQPAPDQLDFSSVDPLIAVISRHNQSSTIQTRVVLTVGARNFLYPELHEPAWAGPRKQPYLNDVQSGAAYRAYIDGTITRYRSSPLLYAWQVENEPLDYVGNSFTGDDQIKVAQLQWEIAEVHRLDPAHKAVTTTFDGWNVAVDMMQLYTPSLLYHLGGWPQGHPEDALDAGDALGLDLYLDGPSTPLRFTSSDLRAEWKEQAIGFWAARAQAKGKELWLAEMQAQPWSVSPGHFGPSDLIASAQDYRDEQLQVVLMWGVDTWLTDPAWMAAATRALAILRT